MAKEPSAKKETTTKFQVQQGKPKSRFKIEPWMTTKPPKDKLLKPRMQDGKEWWWCSEETGGKCQGIYRRHKPADCRGVAKKKEGEGKKPSTKKLKLAKALEATIKAEEAEFEDTHSSTQEIQE